jgi:hypothetical protein
MFARDDQPRFALHIPSDIILRLSLPQKLVQEKPLHMEYHYYSGFTR